MKIIRSADTALCGQSAVALGTFDGMHIGHRKVIETAGEKAREKGLLFVVWSFSAPPPKKDGEPVSLDSFETKAKIIESMGADILIAPPFDEKIRSVTAKDFFYEILLKNAGARELVCGPNYTFGAGAEGNTGLLRKLSEESGTGLTVVPLVTVNGETVSSTSIREAVRDGDMAKAERLLGRKIRRL